MADAIATIRSELEKRKTQLAELLPRHMTPERLLIVALNCISKVPDLQKCTASSLLNSVRVAAELGLEPGGALGGLYLVPFGDTCTPIIGYKGLIELMRRSGELEQIEAHVVHEGDVFEIEYGLTPKLKHVPKLEEGGRPTLAYVIARLKDGGLHVEMMTVAAIEKIKARSRAAKSGPWVTDYEEMMKKTVVRRAAKYLPLASERYRKAIEHDDADYVDGVTVTQPALPADTALAEQVVSSGNERAKEKLREAAASEPGSAG